MNTNFIIYVLNVKHIEMLCSILNKVEFEYGKCLMENIF